MSLNRITQNPYDRKRVTKLVGSKPSRRLISRGS